jgi:hypothetical protein
MSYKISIDILLNLIGKFSLSKYLSFSILRNPLSFDNHAPLFPLLSHFSSPSSLFLLSSFFFVSGSLLAEHKETRESETERERLRLRDWER